MFSSRYRDALSAFEENDQFDGIQSNLAKFQRKQKKQSMSQSNSFDWIREERRLKNADAAISKQILLGISNAISDAQKEIVTEGILLSSGVNSNSTIDAIKSLQDDVAMFQNESPLVKDQHPMNLVIKMKDELTKLSPVVSKEGTALCAKLLLDTRGKLDALEEELGEQYSIQSKLICEHRRKVVSMVIAENSKKISLEFHGRERILTKPLTAAFESLRKKFDQLAEEDSCEIDLLEDDLKKEFADAQNKYDYVVSSSNYKEKNGKTTHIDWDERSHTIFKSILSHSSKSHDAMGNKTLLTRLRKALPAKSVEDITNHVTNHANRKGTQRRVQIATDELEKKHKEIEKLGLKEIELLQKEFVGRRERMEKKLQTNMKRKEMQVRMNLLRRTREEVERVETAKLLQSDAKEKDLIIGKEVKRIVRTLETKQEMWKRQVEQVKEYDEIRSRTFEKDFEAEMERIRLTKTNKER